MKMHTDMQQYLEPTPTIDYDHPLVEEFARKHAVNPHEGREQAVRLYFAVRDGIRYDPYPVSYTHLRAHETPEHLVCRLLLDKKTKKKRQR